ncbi:DciA family protein [Hydrogenophaga flava]|uniref:DciA family protein n=1 Tax=Hydrogenophaga flava TaxID=65657 RepID=UPI001FDF7E69|nr:DciA family protein [Hydrogenophaga flava]
MERLALGQPSIRDNDVHCQTTSFNGSKALPSLLSMTTASRYNRRVFSLEQAVGEEPTLALLQERIHASRNCLEAVTALIPAPLRSQVQPGPLENGEWCLLVSSAAASTKLRQLLPSMRQRLAQNDMEITSIRLKIQTPRR